MSQFKGTPGPWFNKKTDVWDNDGYIAEVMNISDPIEVQIANAQLIAAAPELLEALQDMVTLVKKRAYPQPDKPSSDWGRAEAAQEIINKALGETK